MEDDDVLGGPPEIKKRLARRLAHGEMAEGERAGNTGAEGAPTAELEVRQAELTEPGMNDAIEGHVDVGNECQQFSPANHLCPDEATDHR